MLLRGGQKILQSELIHDLTTFGPEQFITQIKSIVAQRVAQNGAALERVLETKNRTFQMEVAIKKRAVYYQDKRTQNGRWFYCIGENAAYKFNGTEIQWRKENGAWFYRKSYDFGLATEGVTRSSSEFFQIYRADGEKSDTTLDNWIIELDASALGNNLGIKVWGRS